MGILNKAKVAFNKVDQNIGKKVFGNTTGMMRSVSGSDKLDKSLTEELKATNPELYSLKKNGFTRFKNSYDAALISTIREKYEKLMASDEYSFAISGYKNQIYSRAIRDPHKNFPEISKLITRDVVSFLSGYYKSHFKIKHIYCGKNFHVPEDLRKKHEMFSNFWHCDRTLASELKYFVYMSDVTEKDGPFHVQPINRTKELIKMGFGNRDHYDLPLNVLEDPAYMVKMTGSCGTSFFGNATVCLHRAGDPEPNHTRNLIQFIIVPADEPFSLDNWLGKVESQTLPLFTPQN